MIIESYEELRELLGSRVKLKAIGVYSSHCHVWNLGKIPDKESPHSGGMVAMDFDDNNTISQNWNPKDAPLKAVFTLDEDPELVKAYIRF